MEPITQSGSWHGNRLRRAAGISWSWYPRTPVQRWKRNVDLLQRCDKARRQELREAFRLAFGLDAFDVAAGFAAGASENS
jgi:hypothetical protein